MQIQALVFVMFAAALWLYAIRTPRHYVKFLVISAPWHGFYVSLIWNLDLFKVGLLLAPLAMALIPTPPRTKLIRILCVLALYAVLLGLWQTVISQEIRAFDLTGHLDIYKRLFSSTYLFICRLLLIPIVLSVVCTRKLLEECARAYVFSTLILALYGLAQELSFVLLNHPITPIYLNGIFGDSHRFVTSDIFGVTMLRVHSFCMEPKDLALFVTPSIVLVWATIWIKAKQRRSNITESIQFLVLGAAAGLTFSTSLLLMMPLIVLGIEFGRGFGRWTDTARRIVVVGVLVLIFWPAAQQLWQVRVEERIASGETTLLQVSREAPAAAFMLSQLPRSLLGFGIGTQAFYLPAFMPGEYRDIVLANDAAAGIDSFWFTMLLDLGLPGLALAGLACWEGLRHPAPVPWVWPYRAALIATIVMCIPLQGDLRSGLIWIFLAFAWQANRLAHQSRVAVMRYRIDRQPASMPRPATA